MTADMKLLLIMSYPPMHQPCKSSRSSTWLYQRSYLSKLFRFSCKFFLSKRLYFIILSLSHFDPVASLNTPLTADFHTPVVTGSWVHSSRRGFARFSSCQLDHVRDGRVGQLPGCYKRPRSGRVLLAEDTRVYLHLRYAWPVGSAIYAWSDKLAYKYRRCTCYVSLF